MKERAEVVGVPLQRLHQKDYNVYRDKLWRAPSYDNVSSVMYTKGMSILYYYPKYYLGHDGKEGITLNSDVQVSSDVRFRETGQRQPLEQWANEVEFLFADGMDKGQLRKMRRYRIKRFAGHRIYLGEDGRCKMSVGTHRGRFFHDTFYKCPALQSVVLPEGMDVDYTVEDATSGVSYLLPEPEGISVDLPRPAMIPNHLLRPRCSASTTSIRPKQSR